MTDGGMTGGLAGLKVVSFESRMTKELHGLIARQGGQPLIVPAMREVPVEAQGPAFAFGARLLAGEVDVLVLLTGVGTRALVDLLATRHPRADLIAALAKVALVARGPKVVHALGQLGLKPSVTAPEPNTWRDLLGAMDAGLDVAGQRVVVQEYGEPNPALTDGLAERGATVASLAVYRWDLPEDLVPLQAAIREVAEDRCDVALFTSGPQIANVLRVAQREGRGRALTAALGRMAVGSVGPSTTAGLKEVGLAPDFEPEHPKMGHLVLAAAEKARGVLAAKRAVVTARSPASATAPEAAARLAASPFLKACRREPAPYTPIWLMRQAGRYMKEYRLLRETVNFLELCRRPDLAAEVTIHAVERLGVDAAIIFSDLLVIAEPLGFPVTYTKGEGPVIDRPIRRAADVDRVRDPEPAASLAYVGEAVRLARAGLSPDVPLIGFVGAPYTLASYLIEGEGSRTYAHVKAFMYADEGAWRTLLERLADGLAAFARVQAEAGAQVIQVFDSWVGSLSPADYARYVQPAMRRLFAGMPPGVPVIHFGSDSGGLLELMREAGGDVVGVDWRVRLDEAWARIGHDRAVMGNLDPVALFAPPSEIARQADRILREAGGRPGHVFNLGHGILPATPVDHVRALVDAVHERSGRGTP